MAYYLTALSAKLKWLTGIAYDICIRYKRRLIIFTYWPITQWNVEMFLLNLGFNTINIHTQTTQSKRNNTIDLFNDPLNNYQILVTSIRILAIAVNLQYQCSDIILIGVPSNASYFTGSWSN